MKIYLIALMLIIGFVLTLHLAMNAQVGAILKNPRMGNAIFWAIGAFTAIIIGATDWDPTVFTRLKEVPIWLLTAGAMGGALVFGIAWTMPQLGAGNAVILMIAGQIISGMIFSHFGLLGSPVEPISITKLAGALLLIAGAATVTLSK
ncbi:MAG: DMT family transporter [Sphingobacteriaceae bacterium]|nr:MAG: DMT family transporter [Sphingobacteriaceae bacterium]